MNQNKPVILPLASTSIFSAEGTLGKPGMISHENHLIFMGSLLISNPRAE